MESKAVCEVGNIMLCEWHYQTWLKEFRLEGISEEIAREEYQIWAEGLDGEIDNEYLQTELSVIGAAQEAINELKSYESE